MHRPRALAVATSLALAGVAQAASVSASSELVEDDQDHPVEHAFDGLLTTSWSEDETGVGMGAWIEVRLDRVTPIHSVSIWPGDLSKGERSLKEKGRPHTITVVLEGGDAPFEQEIRLRDGAEQGIQRIDAILEGDPTARTVRFRIDDAYAGYVYNETHIAEVALNLLGGPGPDTSRLEAWKASRSGERALAAHEEEVIDLFAKIDDAEFGDRDALRTLMDWTSDGAPWLRARVRRDIDPGFRINAMPPDPLAMKALLKIKDANAIPALRMAALRVTGAESRKLMRAADYFAAYAELASGGRRSIQTWGETGWEKGALRGFGEPLAIGLGLYGDLYITDLANHRVQVFDQNGRVSQVWGVGEPAVTDDWFGGKRPHFVAGRAPSETDGGFTLPLDLDVMQGKEADEITVIDAEGWVQRLGPSGETLARWKVRPEMGASPNVGGAAHVLRSKGDVVVLWNNQGFVFDPEGEQLEAWEIEDGQPVTAVALRNGKIVMGFRDKAVLYGRDGFRHGVVMTSDDLPLGFETWSLGVDERGRLWAVTDHGWLISYKKPGKEAFRLRFSEFLVPRPRFSVYDGMLYVTGGDEIRRVDALELKAEQEAAEAEAEE